MPYSDLADGIWAELAMQLGKMLEEQSQPIKVREMMEDPVLQCSTLPCVILIPSL